MVEHLKIPFMIGAGSGAGNILAKLTTNIVKIAINSSWRDLDLLPEEIVKVRAGHGLGSGSGPKIVEDLKKWFPSIPIIAFVTQPFGWEGNEVKYKAWICGEAVAEKTGTVLIDNEYVRSILGPKLPVTTILNKANQYISSMIDTFLKIATSKTMLSSIDMTDLRRVVERGLVYMFTRTFREDEPLTNIYDSDSTMCKYTGIAEHLPARIIAFIQSPRPPPSTLFDTLKDAAEKNLGLEVSLFKSAVFIGGDRLRISMIMGGFKWWR